MQKFIFITGGVVSSLGKGIASATIGALLQARGFKVNLKKLDPYLNVDPGTMSPTQHGEVFVTDDGYEADLDLGHYERFTDINTSKNSNITTGQVYSKIIEKERKGEYLGKTVQVIPHVTNVIKEFILNNPKDADFILCEIGGTVGDIEGLPFYEAIRQLGFELGRENVCFIHLTYLPYIKMAEELKTKPTQHSVKALQSLGIQPDILLCRADIDIPKNELDKISQFCNVKRENVIPALNANNIYEIPLTYHSVHLDDRVVEHFKLENKEPNLKCWMDIVNNIQHPKNHVKIAVVGKYTSLKESYKSLIEAIKHGGIANSAKVEIVWVESRLINNKDDLKVLEDVDGILVPGGFGKDGTEGKILAIQYAREHKIPYLGICLGMQMAVVEFARNVLNLKDSDSIEFNPNTQNPVIHIMEEQKGITNKGGTMRLGAYKCILKENTKAKAIYQKTEVNERHRHRFEYNNDYKEMLENAGLKCSGVSPDNGHALSFLFNI